MEMNEQYHWWQDGIIYQIYPRSFMDANGDGTGDLQGIIARLDYLAWLGVDAIWISPIFPSPMADFGYDVANYVDVDPLFGSLADFDHLLAETHARGMKLLLDFVPNHTSDAHPWFVAARSGRENPKRNWYIWRDPAANGGPPNNWTSFFGGDAWTFDPATGQYYLHLFDPKQPDLNWRNPAVRTAMYDALRFWLDRGVDGFRVDVMWLLIKDEQFRDNPPNPHWKPGDPPEGRQEMVHTADLPETHEIVREMRAVLDAYSERVLIGEIYLPVLRLVAYYGPSLNGAHLPFNFQLVTLPWQAPIIRQAIADYEAALPPGTWPNWVLGNHDKPRVASRVGAAQARVAQMLLLTLRGTPTLYYGDEIGMHNVPIPPAQAHDPVELRSPGHGRDPVRTPMQWDASTHAGFSSGTPWLPLADDYATLNVATERDDPTSLLTLVRSLIALRRASRALSVGHYREIQSTEDDALVFLREHAGERLLVALNLGHHDLVLDLRSTGEGGTVLLSTHLDRAEAVDLARLTVRPDEGIIIRVA
jgi:alpha-glucosidase